MQLLKRSASQFCSCWSDTFALPVWIAGNPCDVRWLFTVEANPGTHCIVDQSPFPLFCSSPAFLDKLTVHVAKNFLELPKIKVPLILGIWGGKGQGKTFQCSLAYKKLGIGPVVMSAGELESGNAGEPAKLIRQRYR